MRRYGFVVECVRWQIVILPEAASAGWSLDIAASVRPATSAVAASRRRCEGRRTRVRRRPDARAEGRSEEVLTGGLGGSGDAGLGAVAGGLSGCRTDHDPFADVASVVYSKTKETL